MNSRQAKRYTREWSKVFGRRQLLAFERALADPKLTSLRQEIARVDARLTELEERRASGQCELAWLRAGEIALELQSLNLDEPEGRARHLVLTTELALLTAKGSHDYATWHEIERAIELRRKLVDTERKYEELNHYLVPVQKLQLIFAELHAAANAAILDLATRQAFANEFRTRLGGGILGIDKRPVRLLPAPPPAADAAALGDEDDEASLADEPGDVDLDRRALVAGAVAAELVERA